MGKAGNGKGGGTARDAIGPPRCPTLWSVPVKAQSTERKVHIATSQVIDNRSSKISQVCVDTHTFARFARSSARPVPVPENRFQKEATFFHCFLAPYQLQIFFSAHHVDVNAGCKPFFATFFFDYFGGPKLGQGGPKPMPARSLWSLSTRSPAWLWYTSGTRCSHPPQGRHGVTACVDDLVRCTVGSEQSLMWPVLLGNPGEAYSAKKEWRRSLTRLRSKGCRSPRPARGSAFVALRYECR